jgi:lactose/L-arabinose transport system substrate-binding protein
MFDESGKAFIKDNKVLKEALRITKEMVASGVCILVPDWNAYIATLNNGTVASTINGCWISGSIQAEKSQSGKWAVTNTPRFANIASSVNYSSQGGSAGWSWPTRESRRRHRLPGKDLRWKRRPLRDHSSCQRSIATWLPAAKSPVYSTPIEFFGGQKIYEDLVNYAARFPM